MKKVLSLLLALFCLVPCLCFTSCGENDAEGATRLSFKTASSYDYLKTLDGQKVIINGYMATSSPTSGAYMFLMNMPYQSCPFCKPNTSALSNTMEVYAKKNKKFAYTTDAIAVVGTLVVSESQDEPFTDEYGYEFCFKIVDATYTTLSDADIIAKTATYATISDSGLLTEIANMYEYVNFLAMWNTYFVNSTATSTGYYLYASDALNYITKDGAQYNYGYQTGYFERIIADINRLNLDMDTATLITNINGAKQLATECLNALENGDYTYNYEYVEKFGSYDYIYTLDDGEEFSQRIENLYNDYSNWLANWEI